MTNEQFERRMEFIVQQQAQFAVDIQQLQDAQAELTKKHNGLTDALTTVVGMVGKLATAQERTDEQLSELANKQAETDDRLNALIDRRFRLVCWLIPRAARQSALAQSPVFQPFLQRLSGRPSSRCVS